MIHSSISVTVICTNMLSIQKVLHLSKFAQNPFSKDSNKLEHFFPSWNSKNYYQCCCFSSFRSALLFSGSKQPRPDIFIGLLAASFYGDLF